MPKIWGLHNYSDINRLQSWRTRELVQAMGGQVWLTETGGIVQIRRRIPEPERLRPETCGEGARLHVQRRRVARKNQAPVHLRLDWRHGEHALRCGADRRPPRAAPGLRASSARSCTAPSATSRASVTTDGGAPECPGAARRPASVESLTVLLELGCCAGSGGGVGSLRSSRAAASASSPAAAAISTSLVSGNVLPECSFRFSAVWSPAPTMLKQPLVVDAQFGRRERGEQAPGSSASAPAPSERSVRRMRAVASRPAPRRAPAARRNGQMPPQPRPSAEGGWRSSAGRSPRSDSASRRRPRSRSRSAGA